MRSTFTRTAIKNLRHLAQAGLVLAAISGLAVQAAHPEAITIGYQVIPNAELLAKAKGWYESELGVKVNFKQFDSGRDVNTAFAAGSLDFGLAGSAPTSVGISRGLAYKVIWIHDVIGAAESLAVKNKASVSSLQGLKGKTVAVPFGSTAHYSLLNALKLEGVNPADVKILDLQPPDIFAAWQRGDIDAAYVWQPTLGKLLADGHILTDSAILAGKGVVTADIGLVSTDFARKHPDLVVKYVKLQQKAIELYRKDPNGAAAVLAAALGTDAAEALKEAKELVWLPTRDQLASRYLGSSARKGDLAKTLKSTADFLVTQKSITSAPDLAVFEKAIDPSFIEAALK
jgi:taurine transport system substrate-binding protein